MSTNNSVALNCAFLCLCTLYVVRTFLWRMKNRRIDKNQSCQRLTNNSNNTTATEHNRHHPLQDIDFPPSHERLLFLCVCACSQARARPFLRVLLPISRSLPLSLAHSLSLPFTPSLCRSFDLCVTSFLDWQTRAKWIPFHSCINTEKPLTHEHKL